MAIRSYQGKYRAYFKFQGKQYSRVVSTKAEGREWEADEKRRLARLAVQQTFLMNVLTYSRATREYLLDCQVRMQPGTVQEKSLTSESLRIFSARTSL